MATYRNIEIRRNPDTGELEGLYKGKNWISANQLWPGTDINTEVAPLLEKKEKKKPKETTYELIMRTGTAAEKKAMKQFGQKPPPEYKKPSVYEMTPAERKEYERASSAGYKSVEAYREAEEERIRAEARRREQEEYEASKREREKALQIDMAKMTPARRALIETALAHGTPETAWSEEYKKAYRQAYGRPLEEQRLRGEQALKEHYATLGRAGAGAEAEKLGEWEKQMWERGKEFESELARSAESRAQEWAQLGANLETAITEQQARGVEAAIQDMWKKQVAQEQTRQWETGQATDLAQSYLNALMGGISTGYGAPATATTTTTREPYDPFAAAMQWGYYGGGGGTSPYQYQTSYQYPYSRLRQ